MTPSRQAILVVGTGRSGTSAMTGVLQLLGVHLGDKLKIADTNNPKGYFENTEITDLNKKLLSEAGVTWYVTPAEVTCPIALTATLSTAIREHVQGVFGDKSPIAIKDPRLCALLDAYVSALRELSYEVHCVRMRRAFNEVAQSMAVATGAPGNYFLSLAQHYAGLLDEAVTRLTSLERPRCAA